MNIINSSFNIIINGDWNSTYISPSWLAKKVLEVEMVDIEFTGQDLELIGQIKSNCIIIRPSQKRVIIFCADILDESVREFERVFINFLNESISPKITAYGFNISFEEDDTKGYSKIVDNLSDNINLVDNGIIIERTDIIRKFTYKEKPFTLKFMTTMNKLNMVFNYHHDCDTESNKIEINEGTISEFVNNCIEILSFYDYYLEEEK